MQTSKTVLGCEDRVWITHTPCIIYVTSETSSSKRCKAFDYVNHTLLFHELINKDINGKIFNAIAQIYSNPVSCVQVNGELSEWFHRNNGVRQGDSQRPVLFSVFIDDLVDRVREANFVVVVGGELIPMLLYADDVRGVTPNVTIWG